MENKIFAYGTLAEPDVQMKVWGRLASGQADILRGYWRSEIEVDGEKFPLIVPRETENVSGFIIEVSDDELKKIDGYEGGEYKRIEISTENGVSAWVYVKS